MFSAADTDRQVSSARVEARPCPICVPGGGAVENPSLSCALFIADVVSLATARRAEAAAKGRGGRLSSTAPLGSYASDGPGGGGSVRVSVDSGARWQPMHAPPPSAVNGRGGSVGASRTAAAEREFARWGASVAPLDSMGLGSPPLNSPLATPSPSPMLVPRPPILSPRLQLLDVEISVPATPRVDPVAPAPES